MAGEGLARRVLARLGRAGATRADRDLLLGSVLFDERWYSRQAGASLDREAAVAHYLADGHRRGLSPHPLFDPVSLRRRWSAARLEQLGDGDPLTLYLRERLFGKTTHPLFDQAAYVAAVPTALDHPEGPVAHYCEVGAAAGHPANSWLDGDLRAWVSQQYDVALARRDGEPTPTLADLPPRAGATPGLVSLLLVADPRHGPADDVLPAVEAALTGADGERVECVVLDDAGPPLDAVALASLPVRFEHTRVVRSGNRLGPAASRTALLGHAGGATVVLLDATARPTAGWLAPLLDALGEPGVAAVQPVIVEHADGTVRSAGWAVPTDGLPQPLLRGQPPGDAAPLDRHRLTAVGETVLAARHRDVVAAGGVRLDGPLGLVDLALRLPGEARVAPGAVVTHRAAPEHPLAGVPDAERAAFVRDHGDRPADEAVLWAVCGFRVTGRHPDGSPVIGRDLATAERARRLRIAIKNPAPAGPLGETWGDTHFARSLVAAFGDLGHDAVIDHHPAWHRPTADLDDVALVLRGPHAYRPLPGQTTLAWVISHPDTFTREELAVYDRVCAASVTWAAQRSAEWGMDVEPLLQATDPALFGPDLAAPDSGAPVLFVGNSRQVRRPVVLAAVEAGLPVRIYGRGWGRYLPVDSAAEVVADRLDNAAVGAAYRSAGVVLNDHFEDMRRDGFVSNRLFDAAACAARVVTDDVAGLGDLLSPVVQVARTPADVVRLATLPDPDAVFGDDTVRRAVAESVRREHSFRARAVRLLAIVEELRQRS